MRTAVSPPLQPTPSNPAPPHVRRAPDGSVPDVPQIIAGIYRSDSRRILATLIRLLGDFDIAEEAMHDAFSIALEQWSRDGVPANPGAWLISTGRFKAIDSLRRSARFDKSDSDLVGRLEAESVDLPELIDTTVHDDQLRLIFTCCHPALSPDARIALTLREVCGLTTEEIARAYLTTPATLAQRIVRAKSKIREARIPYSVPTASELTERLEGVLQVIYLVFNEGYYASSGASITRADLSGEAIRLGRLLLELFQVGKPVRSFAAGNGGSPDSNDGASEIEGLLALMLLQESRRVARTSPAGELILLEDQDRSLWNSDLIREGVSLVEEALASGRYGKYTFQGAIAAVHAEAPSANATDWEQIVALYDVLYRAEPSSVIGLNRAVAVAMRDGAVAGLALLDGILAEGELSEYHFMHAARGALFLRAGKSTEALVSYERALALAQSEPEKRFLARKVAELTGMVASQILVA